MGKEQAFPNLLIRKALLSEIDKIDAVMKCSMRALGQGHYTAEQIASSCKYVCVPDKQLIEDGTYYVVEDTDGTLLGCGGWSFRNLLYAGPQIHASEDDKLNPKKDRARIRAMFVIPQASGKGVGTLILKTSEEAAKKYGFKRGALGSTQSGLAFYLTHGWVTVKEEMATLPDGIKIKVTHMEKDFI